MEKLKKAGLYGGQLVSISGPLVARYNACLALLGVAPTNAASIHIDGMGWSPEVAAEKGDDYYLNLGEANSNGIIISPEQYDKPVYMPYHSFDRDLMYAVFTAYKKEIKDITKDSAICLHLDQAMDTYYEVFDLLKYNKVAVHFKIVGDLDKHKQEQTELIEEYNTGNNFFRRDIHKKILDSVKKHGDLRKRTLQLEPISVDVSSFYTRAYGGVFILRDFIKDIMVFESLETFNKAISNTLHDVMLFHVSHAELQKTLVDHLIIECNLKKVIKTNRYQRIKNALFENLLQDHEHPMAEILENSFLYKRYFNTLSDSEKKIVNGVELYIEKIALSNEYKRKDLVDDRMYIALHEPHSSLEDEHRALIWKLLVKIMPLDPVVTFWHDKPKFYTNFKNWDDSYQDWVIGSITKNRKLKKL